MGAIYGTSGDDVIPGTSSEDEIFTGEGTDIVNAGDGNDVIVGSRTGSSYLPAGALVLDTDGTAGDAFAVIGGDILNGEGGDDEIYAGYNTVVNGGAGIDLVHLELPFDFEHGAGHSILTWFNSLGINVDLAQAASGSVTLAVGGLGNLQTTLTQVERFDITFGGGDDVVNGGTLDDKLTGGGGNDAIHGGGGDDIVNGDGGADLIYGDAGDDLLYGGVTSPGFDDFAADVLHGGEGDDFASINQGDLFDGGAGTDRADIRLSMSNHSYILNLDQIVSGVSVNFGDADPNVDFLHDGTGVTNIELIDYLELGSGNDEITVSNRNIPIHDLRLNDGDDIVHLIGGDFATGSQALIGGDGHDTLILDGEFSHGLPTFFDFETVRLAAGHSYAIETRFGTTSEALLDGSALGTSDSLTLDLRESMPGATILGGAGNDTVNYYYGPSNAPAMIDLGAGYDLLRLGGNFSFGLDLDAAAIRNVEEIDLIHDPFARNAYTLILADADVAAGQTLTIDGSTLGTGWFQTPEVVSIDGHAELDGKLIEKGGAANDILIGGASDDQLFGGDGNDILDGGAGSDSMSGGKGNDVYYVRDAGDKVVEFSDQGKDTIYVAFSYSLKGKFVENLTLTGLGNLAGTGNLLDNWLIGNSGTNKLEGLAGNDILDGGAGADTLIGGEGNDSYFVDSIGDVVTELADQGNDTVFAAFGYSLNGTNIENLTFTGSGNLAGTGNLLDNRQTGNSGANRLEGLAGNDVLDGGAGADTLIGGEGDDSYFVDSIGDVVTELSDQGNDTVYASIGYSLKGKSVENLTLAGTANNNATGNSFANALAGNIGDNVLDGATGADAMSGGKGNDSYFVDDAGDTVTEKYDEGIDKVYASVSFSLKGQYIEHLTLTGNASLYGIGNSLANNLTGNSGANVLEGLAGNDILNGGLGADILTGGADRDIFLFASALGGGNIDLIKDYNLADDSIQLDRKIFAAIGVGTLQANQFVNGTAALDADDRILYDAASGAVYYDADGNGAIAAIQFATIGNHAALNAGEFLIY